MKHCAHCDTVLSQHPNEKPCAFKVRRTCSRLCSALRRHDLATAQLALNLHLCVVCKRRPQNHGETCSRRCAGRKSRQTGGHSGWQIVERRGKRSFVAVTGVLANEEVAKFYLDDMLAPYPPGDAWRKKLCVREVTA